MLKLRSLAILAGGWWLLTSALDAQSTGLALAIESRDISRNTTPNGTLVRATRAPVRLVSSGQVVGTANMTGVVHHTSLSYFPTVVEIASGSQSIVVSELVSADGAFRQTYAYDRGGQLRIFGASISLLENGLTIRLSPSAALPVASTTFNHAFHFTQPRVINTIANTGIAFRQSTRWSIVPSFGQTIELGSNFSASFINTTQLFSVNYLARPGGTSGAIVTCIEQPTTFCALSGVGEFLGFYGVAASRTPESLGVQADAASDTTLQFSDPTAQRGCPGGLPPPPPHALGILLTGIRRAAISWDSVECATSYTVRLFLVDGTTRDVPTGQPELLTPADTAGQVLGFSVAAFGPGGLGPFSVVREIL